jgi:hypothetical protein
METFGYMLQMQAGMHEGSYCTSGSWFRASAMTTMNKNQPDAQ